MAFAAALSQETTDVWGSKVRGLGISLSILVDAVVAPLEHIILAFKELLPLLTLPSSATSAAARVDAEARTRIQRIVDSYSFHYAFYAKFERILT